MPPGKKNLPVGATHPSTGNDHLTPPSLLVELGALTPSDDGGYQLGADPFDLDPCASMRQPWPTATTMHTEDADGMAHQWAGEVWLNPPYGTQMIAWLARMGMHGKGCALVFARTDTNAFHEHVWARASAVYFFRQRMFFHAPITGIQYSAKCGGPMVLVCYGDKAVERTRRLLRPGGQYPGNLVMIREPERKNVIRVEPRVKRARQRTSNRR